MATAPPLSTTRASTRTTTCCAPRPAPRHGLLAGAPDLTEGRVAFLVPPGFEYVAVQWGIWRAGGMAVPFAVSHPEAELEYTVDDADASIVVRASPASPTG